MTTETFFLPEENSRTSWKTPARIYNLYRSLLIRNKGKPVFVPIRSMQFMAILDQQEINFIDSQSYAVRGDEGGRMILLAWNFSRSSQRETLDNPVPCEVVFFEQRNEDVQRRLVGEFKQAMELIDQRFRQNIPGINGVKIVAIKT